VSYLITADPSKIGDAIEKAVEDVVKFTILRAWQNLTISPAEGGTPRRTGFASASWIVSVGVPSPLVGGSPDSPATVDRSPAARGLEELRVYRLAQGAVFLVNNTDYIGRLNSGYSPQAQAGFVDAAYQQAVHAAEKEFGEL
jgi:hypothetical protein